MPQSLQIRLAGKYIFLAVLLMFSQLHMALAETSISSDKKGVAIDGYDAVAYFVEGKPALGSEKITHVWQGASWRFASVENRDKFAANPEKYAPQYGGYCAYAMSGGGFAAGDGERWRIVDDKLYLNNNWFAEKLWHQDISGNIRDANEHWPKLNPIINHALTADKP